MAFTTPTNNYVLGRGKIYFDKFLPGTLTKTGERYLGNTPSLSVTSAVQNLDHYSSDYGIREKDDSVQLQVDRTINFSCDNISMENVALMYGADSVIEVQVAITGAAELITVNKGLYYQLGADSKVPDGAINISNFVMTNNAGVHASGTAIFAANPVANDTVTIGTRTITFVAGAPVAGSHQVQIGATVTVTAQGFATEVNANKQYYGVSASGAAATITLTALASGVGGNAIALAKSGTNPTVSGANLAGGTASGILTESGNYEIDLAQGRLHILDNAASLTNGQTVECTYNIGAGSRSLVVDEKDSVEGAMRYVADNPKGKNKHYYWPRVKLSPTGEYALKADTWQVMAFTGEVIKIGDQKLVYVREAA